MRTSIPLQQDVNVFTKIIKDSAHIWSKIKSKNMTKGNFYNQPLPEEDIQTPNTDYINLSHVEDIGVAVLTNRRLKLFADQRKYTSSTNAIVYNPMSYMKWHTNSNNVGYRHYYTFTTKEAIFRWIDPTTGEIHDEIDNKGWTYRVFKISDKDLLWHTIWSEGVRFSFGFNSNELET